MIRFINKTLALNSKYEQPFTCNKKGGCSVIKYNMLFKIILNVVVIK